MPGEKTRLKNGQGTVERVADAKEQQHPKCPKCGNTMCIMTVTAGHGWYCTRCGGNKIYFDSPRPCAFCGRDSVTIQGNMPVCGKCGRMRICEDCYDETCCFAVFSRSTKPNASCKALAGR